MAKRPDSVPDAAGDSRSSDQSGSDRRSSRPSPGDSGSPPTKSVPSSAPADHAASPEQDTGDPPTPDTRNWEAAMAAMFQSSREPTLGSDSASRVALIRSRADSNGRYQIRGRIGRGGQGAVYEIWDEDLARRAAMKVVMGKDSSTSSADTPPADPETVSRFLAEAQVTGQLDHPGVVPVHELGLDAFNHVYFTMRLVQGDDLSQVFAKVKSGEGGWTIVRVLGVLLKACEALAYAHSKGVIHRDLKPSNLMVGNFGEVYVMDWGLARVRDQEDQHDLRIRGSKQEAREGSEPRESPDGNDGSGLVTMDGRVLGTPCYMSPEQAEGRVEAMSSPSDVYSMGAVLYQLLTGHIPYLSTDEKLSARDVLDRVRQGSPPPLTKLAPETPHELVAICEKAMARPIDQRYPDMTALAADLRAFLEHRVVEAYERGAWAELRKWVTRNRGWAMTGVSALVLLVAMLGWAVVERQRANGEAARAVNATNAERLAKEDAISEREKVLRLSDMKLVEQLVAEADSLWPVEQQIVGDLEAWILKSTAVVDRITLHQGALSELREHADPWTPEERVAQRESHEFFPSVVQERARLEWLRTLSSVVAGGAAPALLDLEGEELPMQAVYTAWEMISPDRTSFGSESRGAAIAERIAATEPGSNDPSVLLAAGWGRFATGRFDEGLRALEMAVSKSNEEQRWQFEAHRDRLISAVAVYTGEGARDRDREQISNLEGRIAAFEHDVAERKTWRFPSEAVGLTWQHELLSELVVALGHFSGPKGTVEEVRERLEWASNLREITTSGSEAAAAWKDAIKSIQDPDQCPLYEDWSHTPLTPQLGLVPLDRNPRTGLWEFWHPQSGVRPDSNAKWNPDDIESPSRWIMTKDTSLVFVLIPGGQFMMGAERPRIGTQVTETEQGLRVIALAEGSLAVRAGVAASDLLLSLNGIETPTRESLNACLPTLLVGEEALFIVLRGEEQLALTATVEVGVGTPNIDPWAEVKESPINEVALRPFFISKYEMTQEQWSRSPAERKTPSFYFEGYQAADGPVSAVHPVERVDWTECKSTLEKLALMLPTEAQWEMCCRAGMQSVYWSGNQLGDLRGAGNFAEVSGKRLHPWWICTKEIDDGHGIHAPVGSYRPNGFGIHDTIGNVIEWCLETNVNYGQPAEGPNGYRPDGDGSSHNLRGGGFQLAPEQVRSAWRFQTPTATRDLFIGVRPCRPVLD